MPIFITQGRYTREAIKGMIVKPEDRYESLSRHVARTGGRDTQTCLVAHSPARGANSIRDRAQSP